MSRPLPRHTRALLALSALNFKFGPDWHVFASDQGRLWATTTRRPAIDYQRGMKPVGVPDAVTADSPRHLALKLSAISDGGSRQGAAAANKKG